MQEYLVNELNRLDSLEKHFKKLEYKLLAVAVEKEKKLAEYNRLYKKVVIISFDRKTLPYRYFHIFNIKVYKKASDKFLYPIIAEAEQDPLVFPHLPKV